jgi:hypothetical protein
MHNNIQVSLKRFIQLIVLVFSFSFFCITVCSQNNIMYAHAALAEKIYLQLDSKVYTTDKTIWFKAIVTNAIDHAPTTLSGVLYVELVDPNAKIIEKKVIKIERGIGDGSIKLNQSYTQGLYLIRAYTEWDKNFGSDFFFQEYINVFAPPAKVKTEPISNITLTEGQNNNRKLTAILNPLVIDSLHKKDLTLFISHDEKKDTLFIKKDKNNRYPLDYIIPNESRFVTLQIQTTNHLGYSKTIVLNKECMDLQFFPESGELVQGIPTIVGFKALDCTGKEITVEGEIVNEQGEVIVPFKSNPLGMGSFMLNKVDSNIKYFARLMSQTVGGAQKLYPLPLVAIKGNVLSVKMNEDQIQLKACSNYQTDDSVTIRASCRGVIYYDIKGQLKNGALTCSLTPEMFPEGIIAFTMLDSSLQPVAERLYFNERLESRINIALSTDKETYMQREPTKLDIQTLDSDDEPVNANLSILVLNKKQMGKLQSTRQNILSYFLLSSDLKGEIKNPGFYFSNDENRYNDLDALLLTQGWRKYNYTKPVDKILFQPEINLTVSGVVSDVFLQNKRKRDIGLILMTFGKNSAVLLQTTDSLGKFSFKLNDEFGQDIKVLIKSTNKSGIKKDYIITLDKKESMDISFNQFPSLEIPDSIILALVEKETERKKIDDNFRLTKGDILLKEVEVKAYRMTPERKKVTDEYGAPKVIIEGKDIREKERKWSYGLYSVLMMDFPHQIRIDRDSVGDLIAKANNPEKTLYVVDGIPVMPYDYSFIQYIPPSEVTSVEVITYASGFQRLFSKIYPAASQTPAFGNVIAIYTFGKKGLSGAKKPVGILQTSVPVFSEPIEFYSPKYNVLTPESWITPDLRALIHWEPKLKVNSTGKATTEFYNADNTGEMQVVVEAISDKGDIGYKELFYNVKKRD